MRFLRLGLELAWIDWVNRFKWSKIGVFWPLVSFSIYGISVSFVYGNIFGTDFTDYLPYLTSGLISWFYLQIFFIEGVNALNSYKGLILNIKLPIITYYYALLFKALLMFLFQFPVFFIFTLFQDSHDYFGLVLLPLALFIVGIFGVNLARTLALLGVLSRDLVHLMPSIITIFTFITPILFPESVLNKVKFIYEYNPIYYLVRLLRSTLTGSFPQPKDWMVVVILCIVTWFIAEIMERTMAKKIVPLI